LRRRMSQAARTRVREHFTFEVQAQAYVDLFDELLELNCVAA
jgi:glycosyltransferase involved in cell wall biosynthesis